MRYCGWCLALGLAFVVAGPARAQDPLTTIAAAGTAAQAVKFLAGSTPKGLNTQPIDLTKNVVVPIQPPHQRFSLSNFFPSFKMPGFSSNRSVSYFPAPPKPPKSFNPVSVIKPLPPIYPKQ